jgi:hypothetical protein
MSKENERLAQKTRRQLQEYRMAFTDIRFDLALNALPDEDQKRAALGRLGAALTVLRIDNDGFESIAKQLESEAPKITKSVMKLDNALDDLMQAKAIIDSVATVINLVARVINIVGIELPI